MLDMFIVQQYKGFSSEVTSLIFSPMEHLLFAGSYAGTVIAYDLNAQNVLITFKEHLATIGAMAVGGT